MSGAVFFFFSWRAKNRAEPVAEGRKERRRRATGVFE